MPNPAFIRLEVTSPESCVGEQELQMTGNPNVYMGSQGHFSRATLAKINDGGTTSWEAAVEDHRSGTGCYGTTRYRRNPPADDPVGSFCVLDTSGEQDCDAGTLETFDNT